MLRRTVYKIAFAAVLSWAVSSASVIGWATTLKKAAHTRQTPNIVNGHPVPIALSKLQANPHYKAALAARMSATADKNAHFTGTLSASENILKPMVAASLRKATSSAAATSKASVKAKAAATSDVSINFPGFQKTPFAVGAPSTDTSVTYASVSADFDNDGKPDVAVVQNDGTVNILLNPGTSSFSDWKISSSNTTAVLNPGVFYLQAQAVDVNADGYPDLEVIDLANNALFVYINNKNGTFKDPIENDVAFSTGTSFNDAGGGVVLADVNGDKIPDMVAVGFYQYQDSSGNSNTTVDIVTMLGKGDGTFSTTQTEQTTHFEGELAEEYGQLTGGDFNGDGNFDLLIPAEGYSWSYVSESFQQVLLGKGDGTFATFPSDFPTTGAVLPYPDASYGSHYVADINGDGNLDVLYSPAAYAGLWLALGNGDGTLQTPTEVLSDLGNITNGGAPIVNFADVNGDGKVDAIAYNLGFVAVYLNGGKGVFNTQPVVQLAAGLSGVTQPLPGDFNNDGNVDLAMVDETSSHVGFYAGGSGTFAGVSVLAPTGESASGFVAFIAGDVNGDGYPDVVAQDLSLESDTIYYPDLKLGTNDGTGNFTYTTAISSTAMSSIDAVSVYPVLADFNADGKSDFVLSGYASATNSYGVFLALSNGDGTYATPTSVSLGATLSCGPGFVDVGDLNGDGFKDIVVAYGGDNSCGAYEPGTTQSGVFILLNDGKGNFTSTFMTYGYGAYLPKLIDFNGDGNLDLALSDANSTEESYYLYVVPGNGDGTFNTGSAQYALENAFVTAIIPGDYDSDGVQDLTVGVETQVDGNDTPANYTTGVYLMKGNGDFTFQLPQIYDMGTFAYDGKYADFDGDGRPDLALNEATFDGYTDIFTPSFAYLENVGGGAFIPGVTNFSATSVDGGVAFVGDFNGDGATDVLVSAKETEAYTAVVTSELFLNTGGDSLSLTASETTATQDSSVTLTAAVTASVSNSTPSGTVTFYDNGTALETATLSGGSVSITLTTLPVGTDLITAKYSGDANFNAATATSSVTVTVATLTPAFTLGAATPTSLSLVQGQSGSIAVTLTSNATFSGTVNLTCSGAPSESTCTIYPSSVTLSGVQSTSASVVIATTAPNNVSAAANHMPVWMKTTGSLSLAGVAFLMWPGRRRRLSKLGMFAVLAAVSLGAFTTLTGCGGGGYKYPGTTIGTTTITVTATSGSSTQTQTFTIAISK